MSFSQQANQLKFPFTLPELPYPKDALKPHISSETFDYHHGKHHQAYVNNLNKLLEQKPELTNNDLEQIIKVSFGDKTLSNIFNNAAQVWNHTFFWHSMSPKGGGQPEGALLAKIKQDFGNLDKFIEAFSQVGVSQFGSGWVWLVLSNGKMEVTKTSNAETPICYDQVPLLCCDVWEHAYYIDYHNRRPDFLNAFITRLANWEFAAYNLLNSK